MRWIFWFLLTLVVYLTVLTQGKLPIPEDIDFYNPMARSWLVGRLDIDPVGTTQDLSYYGGKWYVYFGPLPGLVILVLQLLFRVETIPLGLVTAIIAAVGVATANWVLVRVEKEWFGTLGVLPTLLTLALAFGSQLFWVAVQPGIWFHVQVYAFLLTVLGLAPMVRPRRSWQDYCLSVGWLSLNLLVRPISALWVVVPGLLFLNDRKIFSRKRLLVLCAVVGVVVSIYGGYNWLRFKNAAETGLTYQQSHPHYQERLQRMGGWFSWRNVPYNLWFFLAEIPAVRLVLLEGRYKVWVGYNPEGNSVLFFMPVLLGAILVVPWRIKKNSLVVATLWLGMILVMGLTLSLSGTGWYQVGYRYVLDILWAWWVLVMVGARGKVSGWMYFGVGWAVFLWTVVVLQRLGG